MAVHSYLAREVPVAVPSVPGPARTGHRPGQGMPALQRSHGNQAVQALVRRRARRVRDELGGRPVEAGVDAVLRRRRGRGAPLPAATAARLGAGFGADLAGVRVHTGPEAAAVSGRLGATAFSYGTDLYFGSGAYRPHTTAGRHLLAHEIAHTLQPGPTAGPPTVGRAADPAERAADVSARRALSATGPAGGDSPTPRPASRVVRRKLSNTPAEFGPLDKDSGQGTWAEVKQLGLGFDPGSETGNHPGFKPFDYTQMFGKVATGKGKTAVKYVQGHLLNGKLGGPGEPGVLTGVDSAKNLTAFPANPTNADHKDAIEKRVVEEVRAGRWYHYKVSIKYGKDSVPLLIRKLRLTKDQFDKTWGTRTGITSTDAQFSYAEELTAEAQRLDETKPDLSGSTVGEKQVVTMSIPSPLSFLSTLGKRKNEFPDLKDDKSLHRPTFKGAQSWSNVDYPMDWTKTAMNPAPAAGATSTSASGRKYVTPMRWRGLHAASIGKVDPAQTNPSYAAGVASYHQGVADIRDGNKVSTVRKTVSGKTKIEYDRMGKAYTAGRVHYTEGVEAAAAQPWSATALPVNTHTGGKGSGFDDYLNGVVKAHNGVAPSTSPGEVRGHADFLLGLAKKPAPSPVTYGYLAGQAS